ncbi:hypothetical protein FHX08_002789 [Rhizobium sp. BK529]|nr:hypothetical protein [Rhizobium sp. BK529]TCS06835.1 hypothetical protein EV281_102443 [Rhizobium sp. BK418]
MYGPQVGFTFDKPFLTEGFQNAELINGEKL